MLAIIFRTMCNQDRIINRLALFFCLLSIALGFTLQQNALYTTFTVYYPDNNLNGLKIYLRGDSCNLTWTKGALLNHSAPNQWQTALLCPENATISVKALLNDSSWMFGGNNVFKGGAKSV